MQPRPIASIKPPDFEFLLNKGFPDFALPFFLLGI